MNDTVIVRRPAVAQAARKTPTALIAAIFGMLGLSIFLWLSAARAFSQNSESGLPALAKTVATDTTTPAPLPVPPAIAPASTAPFVVPTSGPVTLTATPTPVLVTRSGYATPATITPAPPTDPMRDRMGAPVLVVDLMQALPAGTSSESVQMRTDTVADDRRGTSTTSTTSITTQPSPGVAIGNGAANQGGAVAGANTLNDSERFASRVGNEELEVAEARQMAGLDRLIPQGAVIGAVMETALNSDLPGYARAIITREVRSFDGSTILIPPGSRVIGQYKSGIAQGASRVFVVWTRLIRPDGVSIELASPATDDLGRAGIGGHVNSHFLARFGGAILTSVLSGGINAATAALSRGSVYVSSASQASGLAGIAAGNTEIPPTITTRQGATVRIFVARDLDFSRVGPAR
jgi:type IV secretory pathway VirB10-like protein